MEFVVVTFTNTRSVNIDGAPRGRTGQLLRLQAGTHNFDLGTPPDYAPANVMAPVRGTTATAPMIIAFRAVAVAARRRAAVPATAAKTAAAARRSSSGKRARKKSAARKTSAARKRSAGKSSTRTAARKKTARRAAQRRK